MSDLAVPSRRRDPNNALAMPQPRFGIKYNDIDLNKVDPTLLQLVRAGAEWLPDGYRVVVTSGDRPNPSLKGSRHKGGHALDVEIIDPNGNALPNEGAPGGGPMYRRLAHGVYNEAHKISPELAAKVGWGGEFESVPPTATRRGSGLADYMHFDLAGRRGPPTWRQEGWAMPAAPGSAPPTQLAAAAPVPPITSPLDVGDPSTWPKTYNLGPFAGPVPGQGPVPVQPLAQTAAPALPVDPAVPPPAYAQTGVPGMATGQRLPQSAYGAVPPQPPAAYSEVGVGTSGPSDDQISFDENKLFSGLRPPQRDFPGKGLEEPFLAQQPAWSGPPHPDLAPNLYSGGVVPGAMAGAQQAETQRTDTTLAQALAGGGPSEPGPRDTAGAGGPSDKPKYPYEEPDMKAAQVAALIGAIQKGMKVTPINWDPFAKILAQGQADASFPKSALQTSPLGKLVNVHSTEPISSSVPGIQPRPVQAAEAAAPRNISERMNLGLRERKDVRAGAETAA